jgi:uncharacterized membrane protein (TIGR01666 family)
MESKGKQAKFLALRTAMERSRQIRYFFFSQYFADGIRITLEIVVPAIVFSLLGEMETGLTISLGAMCVSSADGPGPVIHKRNGMLFCNIFVFISAFLTGILNHNMILLGILIMAASFFFTMFSVYGARASSVGFAALLIMILEMSETVSPGQALTKSVWILCGGIWYMIMALWLFRLAPHKPARRSLGECVYETAKYLMIKSEMYYPASDLEKQYRLLLNQQIIVNEKQNFVRDLLFRNRALLRESTRTGRLLVLTFTDVVDLFEHIMATWYDYPSLRKKYGADDSGILEEFSITIKNLATELSHIGEAIQAGNFYQREFDLPGKLEIIRQKIDKLQNTGSTFMLKKILVNLRSLGEKVGEITKYFNEDLSGRGKLRNRRDYSRFVSHQKINGPIFLDNFTFKSSVFRHSLRMMIACGVGFIISKSISQGHHSYWIIMTIIIILKPSFSLTKKKNFDRILGTLAGGILGLVLLFFFSDPSWLLAFLLFFMVGTYTFKTLNYIVMVIFLTPYILILFHFLGLGALHVAGERLADTAIGSTLAFLASYFLFPQWESGQLQKYMAGVLNANINYLRKLKEIFAGHKISSLEYNLARKELFVSTANLSGGFNSMLSEPKSKQSHRKEIYEFVVLNHVLSSNIASLTASTYKEEKQYPKLFLSPIINSLLILEKSLHQLEPGTPPTAEDPVQPEFTFSAIPPGDPQLKEQLDFIYKAASDIGRLTGIIVS